MTLSSTDYALLSQDSYKKPVIDKSITLGGVEYRAIEAADNPGTGFQATAYQRRDTKDIVIAFRGTEFGREPVHDGGVDAGMVLAGVNAQTADSVAFTKKVMERAEKESSGGAHRIDVTVTGHSLGGTLAEINAAKFGLKGETFNAYGAAGLLQGVPHGGHQVIDHVRAGDPVSAASAHFGEVRIYAAQQDIDKLGKAGYRDDGGMLTPRNPIAATDFNAHAMENFVPENKLLGASIISTESQARYRAHAPMIDRYRSDIDGLRTSLSASWEVPRAVGEASYAAGQATAAAVSRGAHIVGAEAKHVAHEVSEVAGHVRDDVVAGAHVVAHDVNRAAHAVGDAVERVGAAAKADLHAAGNVVREKASHAWDAVSHPGTWFADSAPAKAPARLDHPSHPDHTVYQQARNAVHRMDAGQHRAPDQRSDNLAAALTVAARQHGLARIDHATLSDDASRTFAIQGEPHSPLKRVAEVSTQHAVSTSIEQSTAALASVDASKQASVVQAQHSSVNTPPRPHP